MTHYLTQSLDFLSSVGSNIYWGGQAAYYYGGGQAAYNLANSGIQATEEFYEQAKNCLIGALILNSIEENLAEYAGAIVGEQVGAVATSAVFEKVFYHAGTMKAMGLSLILANKIGSDIYAKNAHKSLLMKVVYTSTAATGIILAVNPLIAPILQDLSAMFGAHLGHFIGSISGAIIGGYVGMHIYGTDEPFFDSNFPLHSYVIKIMQCMFLSQLNALSKGSEYPALLDGLNDLILGALIYNMYSICSFIKNIGDGRTLDGYLNRNHSLLKKVISPQRVRWIADSITGQQALNLSRNTLRNSRLVDENSFRGLIVSCSLTPNPMQAAFDIGSERAAERIEVLPFPGVTASFNAGLQRVQDYPLAQRLLLVQNPLLHLNLRDVIVPPQIARAISHITSIQLEQYIDSYKNFILRSEPITAFHRRLTVSCLRENRPVTAEQIAYGKALAYETIRAPFQIPAQEDLAVNRIIDTLYADMPINGWSAQLVALIENFERDIVGTHFAPEGLNEFISGLLKIHLGPYLLYILSQQVGAEAPPMPREEVIKSIYKNICDLSLYAYSTRYPILKAPVFSSINTQLKRQIQLMEIA